MSTKSLPIIAGRQDATTATGRTSRRRPGVYRVAHMRPAAIDVSRSVRIVVALVLVVQMAVAVAAIRAADAVPFGTALAAVVAVALAVVLLRRPVNGPDIHDRQLDLILVTGGAVAVGVLAVAQLTGSAHELGLLAAAPAAVAALAATVGTRRLWQLRGVPVVLAAGWPGPWSGPVAHLAVVVAVTATILLRGALRSRRRRTARTTLHVVPAPAPHVVPAPVAA